MDDLTTRLGPKGLIKKHEFVRIIVQCLYTLGYNGSAASLESESGITYKSSEFELLESQCLDANWNDCINSLYGIKDLMDETRDLVLFIVFKQWFLECLNCGDEFSALAVLQKRISKLHVSRKMIHNLAVRMLSLKDMETGKINDHSMFESRERLLIELDNLLPPPITLPERRLEHLVEMAVNAQIKSCIYHNSSDAISLYKDHHCGRDQIPVVTVQILTDHKNEVWFVEFSGNGEYLASSSSDFTAIIWKVLEDGKLTLKHTLQGHQKPVSFVAWSPDDTMLLTCGNGEVLKLWDVETAPFLGRASLCATVTVMRSRLGEERGSLKYSILL